MSGGDPRSWVSSIVGAGFSLLAAAAALYCAVMLVESILPALIVIGGIVGLLVLVVVAIRVRRNNW